MKGFAIDFQNDIVLFIFFLFFFAFDTYLNRLLKTHITID